MLQQAQQPQAQRRHPPNQVTLMNQTGVVKMQSKRAFLRLMWLKLPPVLTELVIALLGITAYLYTAVMSDIGDTVLGPPIVQEALRAIIVAQIMRAFAQRWDEFTFVQRLGWCLVVAGIIFNLARGHFSGTPLTLSFALLHTGLIIITWRLMSASRREKRLASQLDESESIRRQQDEVIADLQADKERIGKQAKEFEVRARTAEELLARYAQQETHDHD